MPLIQSLLTIKQASGPLPARIRQTVARNELWALQTPQIMRREALIRAYEECVYPLEQVTDDLQLLELTGRSASGELTAISSSLPRAPWVVTRTA